MKDALEKLKEFHLVFNCARQGTPGKVSPEVLELRHDLMREELRETEHAMLHLQYAQTPEQEIEALCKVADGLADLCYVVIGTAVSYGIPLDRVFEEVHRSNMEKSKKCPVCFGTGTRNIRMEGDPVRKEACWDCNSTGRIVFYRNDGKVLKPEGWTPPDIKGVLGL